MKTFKNYNNQVISIFILFLISSCWNLSLDHEIKNGVNYVFDNETNNFKRVFYAKNHKYCGFIYEFYNNGMIRTIQNTADKYQRTLVYNESGELVCYRYEYRDMNINTKMAEISYKYVTIDSSIFAIVCPGKLILVRNMDTLKIEKPMYREMTIHPSEYLIQDKLDSIEISGIIADENTVKRLVSIPK